MSTTIQLEAARWFTRLQGAAPDDPERSRFEAWLASHPAHAREFAAFTAAWEHLGSPARCNAAADHLEQRHLSRRRLLARSTTGLLLAGVAAEVFYYRWQNEPLAQWARATGRGEVRREALGDGSTLVLNAGTDLAITFSRATRQVQLRRGEAIFDVAPDASRPFVVEAGAARITVLGTRFAVNRLSDRTRVSVDHGRVQVATGPFWRRQGLLLQDGQVAELAQASEGQAEPVRLVSRSAADAFGFENGFIFLRLADLAEVAETLSRHSRQPVRVLPGRAGADPRVTLSTPIADLDSVLDRLPKIAPIEVRRTGGAVLLRAL